MEHTQFKPVKTGLFIQYLVSLLSIFMVGWICHLSSDLINYRSVGLLLLATVSILAIFLTIYPVLIAATVSALIWDYFFIPPFYTFHIESSEDVLMLSMYFIIALLNGVLTSKVRQLEKLALQKDERQNTLKLYKTLFNSISHELRTPISVIVVSTDNLSQQSYRLSESDKSKLIEEVSLAAFRLNRLIDNLLNMQRLESGFLETKPDWCEINELINCPLRRLQKELENHIVEKKIPDDFPIVKLDFGLIEQALFNILHNASVYTPPGTTITITSSYKNGFLTIEITDTGDGFTRDEQKHLFNRFYRVKKVNTGGVGLGLSIAKGFAEAHNGKLWVENNQPHGARFIMQLPCEYYEVNDDFDFSNVTLKESVLHEHKNEYIDH